MTSYTQETLPDMNFWAVDKIDSAKFAQHALRKTDHDTYVEMSFDGIPQPYRDRFLLVAKHKGLDATPDLVVMSHDRSCAWVTVGWK